MTTKEMELTTLQMIKEGYSIQFSFKHEAERFAKAHELKIKYNNGELIDNEHYEVEGSESKLYWLQP